ncbi:hypothetical protein O7626_40295 [Micromonospora sp. WMMD1102]|uniref:hypothetical protein n=1 Tax=Micromonospora sp. WMMD1102 TaxID=3016105 RepID=UPI00241554C0|nr:hypothetical protein [Micromonospora sp. WMMD1102]MDG4792059.1 hypothetical protein [Micromonospora sp. WMMD1102]
MKTNINLAPVFRRAAALVRERGHHRHGQGIADNATSGPVSLIGALRVAADDMRAGDWMTLLSRVADYWTYELRTDFREWEWENRDRDLTVELANHLNAAATYTR